MQILLIRHAKGANNTHPKWLSRREYNHLQEQSRAAPLTPQGEVAARRLADELKHVPVRRLYASPFARTRQMAQILGRAWHVRPQILPTLRELVPAELPHGLSQGPYWWFLARSFGRMLFPLDGGETWYHGFWRAWGVWHMLGRQREPVIAVVLHGRFLGLMLMLARLHPRWQVRRRDLGQSGVSRVTLQPVAQPQGFRRLAPGARRAASLALGRLR